VTDLHVIVPDTVDRADRPSGGNTYDRRVCTGLADLGWAVHEHPVAGAWPEPGVQDLAALAQVVSALPDGCVTLVDGLIASCSAEVLVPQADRLRLVVLVHMPLGRLERGSVRRGSSVASLGEGRVLSAADTVLTTSDWTRRALVELYGLDPTRLHVAVPGVDPAEPARGTDGGGGLLCVAAVTPAKGHDRLIEALGTVADLPWRCVCAGSLSVDPGFVDGLLRERRRLGLTVRVDFVGALSRADLDRAYAAADVLVLASRAETYGMVVSEALARGLPVVATSVGGVPEALGAAADGSLPGLLVDGGEPERLAGALRAWLTDADLRDRLRGRARERRLTLPGWATTSRLVSAVLARVSG
jgi:glycosyltransferase involved in cell wall biosynthesis